jgi:flagellar M-ring protein FliF
MDQLLKLIAGLTWKQRASIVLAALLVVAGIVSFVHWKHESDFRPLYTGMAPEDAAAVVQKLRESGVEFRLADNGGTVLVNSAKLAESRLTLAAAGLPKSGRIGFELFDKTNFGATEFVEHINYKRALEGELERSVMSLAEVEEARVHLTLPKESVFLDQQQPAKASVMVKLRPGTHISQQNVLAVTNLVASAVEGLSPDAVSLVDMDGNLLNRPRRPGTQDGSAITAETLEMRQQIERNLVAKINDALDPLLGPDGFRAGASVDYDLTSGDQQEETLDPTHSVMVSSQKTEDLSTRAASGGIPGTASNLPGGAGQQKGNGGTTRRTENITYQTSRVVRRTNFPQGIVKHMSLAVLVDQTVRWEGTGAARHRVVTPPSPEMLKTIHDLVAAVTGLNADRGDQLVVETQPFETSLNAEPPMSGTVTAPKQGPKLPPWQEFLNKYRSLWIPAGVGLLVILILLFGVIKMMRPKRTVVVSAPAELEAGEAGAPELAAAGALVPADQFARKLAENAAASESVQVLDRVREVAKMDPTLTANVIRAWMDNRSS